MEIKGRSLIDAGKFGCGRGAMVVQLIMAPREIATTERVSIG